MTPALLTPLVASLVPAAIEGLRALPSALAGAAATPQQTGGFGEALEQALSSAATAAQQADRAAGAALNGAGSITDAVVALARADLALQAVSAVRDRAVQAYQDIARSLA
jgi:flagellar hook-basal body complex protein FliE